MIFKKGDSITYKLFGEANKGTFVEQDDIDSKIAVVMDGNGRSWFCVVEDINPLVNMSKNNPNFTFKKNEGGI